VRAQISTQPNLLWERGKEAEKSVRNSTFKVTGQLTGAVGIVFRRHEAVIAGALVIAAAYPLGAHWGKALVTLGAVVAQPCLYQHHVRKRIHY